MKLDVPVPEVFMRKLVILNYAYNVDEKLTYSVY